MTKGSLLNGLFRPRPFICIRCRLSQLPKTSIPSQSTTFRSSVRSYATAPEPKPTTEAPVEPSNPPPSEKAQKKASRLDRKARRAASKKAVVDGKPRKVGPKSRRRKVVRKVITKLVIRNPKSDRPVAHLKAIEDVGTSLEKSLMSSKRLKRGPATVLEAKSLKLDVIDVKRPPVPQLAHGLDRVLFNPGVAHVRDPRSRVLNFDPHMEKLMPVRDFDFNTLNIFTPPSKDQTLARIARDEKKKYTASTSSMTGVLKHFHFLLSNWRGINFSMLSKSFPVALSSFTKMTRGPDAVFLRWKGHGVYAVDADKMYDGANVLSLMGRYMEKLLTLDKRLFARHRVGSEDVISEEERREPEAFHYSTIGDFVLRSQLDAFDERLPGTGMFDLKTRAVVPIRMDSGDFEHGMGYEIRSLRGEWQSFEREYHDMIRSTMLKYSLQVRMGRMDGIFVAFHNIARIFGFQYVSLDEMDNALHGQWDRTLGDQEFLASLKLMNEVFNRATEKFPEQTLRFHFETRETQDPFMYVFAEPVTEGTANKIQRTNKEKIKKWEKSILSRKGDEPADDSHVETSEPDTSTLPEGEAVMESEEVSELSGDSATNIEQDETSEILPSPEITAASGDLDTPTIDDTTEAAAVAHESVTSASNTDTTPTAASTPESESSNAPIFTSLISSHASDIESKAKSDSIEQIDDTSLPGDASVLSTLRSPTTSSNTSSNISTEPLPPLLAFHLYIRSNVNSRPVPRPQNPFTANDTWDIHYTLTPIESLQKSWSLYNACKARRHKEMSEEARQEKGENDYFKNILRRVTAEGREWRAKLEEDEAVELRLKAERAEKSGKADEAGAA